MAGYSGTPLAKKLGIKPEFRVFVMNAPAGYRKALEPVPAAVQFTTQVSTGVDIAHLFVAKRGELQRALASSRRRLGPDAAVWVSWPKKSSGIPSEITEHTIRELALPLGFVDVKVCAVDDVWSGLKLVVRRELRK